MYLRQRCRLDLENTRLSALLFVPCSEIMDAGRVRTVLGCGNPFKPTCALWRTKIPYAFAVGEPATMSRPLKLKVQEPRGLTVFQLPDHGFTRAVCGGVPQTISPDPFEETDMVPLPFRASSLPSNQTCRCSLSGLLRYDCFGLIGTNPHPFQTAPHHRRRKATSCVAMMLRMYEKGS